LVVLVLACVDRGDRFASNPHPQRYCITRMCTLDHGRTRVSTQRSTVSLRAALLRTIHAPLPLLLAQRPGDRVVALLTKTLTALLLLLQPALPAAAAHKHAAPAADAPPRLASAAALAVEAGAAQPALVRGGGAQRSRSGRDPYLAAGAATATRWLRSCRRTAGRALAFSEAKGLDRPRHA